MSTQKPKIDSLPCCYYHKDETIQNFCCSPGCYLPLCPKCIQTHIGEHEKQGTLSTIQSYSETILKVLSSIQQSTQRLESQLTSFKEYTPGSNVAHYIETINKSKQVMMDQLNIYFDTLKKRIEDSLQLQYRNLVSIGADNAEEIINKEIEVLRIFETDISTKGHLPSIIKYLSQGKQLQTDQLIAQIQNKKQTYKDSLPSLNINLTDLNNFYSKAICLTIPSKPLQQATWDANVPAMIPAIPPPFVAPTFVPRLLAPDTTRLVYSRRLSPSSRRERINPGIATLQNQLKHLRSQRISSTTKAKFY